MGQAVIDLPENAEQMPAPLQSADDLLSQLAGAEIDRLLADSGSEPAAEKTSDPALDAAFDHAAAPQSEAQVDDLLKEAAAEATATAEVLNAIVAPTASDFAAEARSVFAEAEATVPAPAIPDPSPEIQTSAAEHQALGAAITDIGTLTDAKPLHRDDEKPSILVRVLELFNAPFAACPEILRDSLGKIAILTFMNALAVLLYIFLFNRH